MQSTGDVQTFEIISEEGVAAGTRRIVALTGEKARTHAIREAGKLGYSLLITDRPLKTLGECP